jgi:hypothetical protein
MEPFCVASSTLCIKGKVKTVLPAPAEVIGPTEINARFSAPPLAVEMVGSPTSCKAANLKPAAGTFGP